MEGGGRCVYVCAYLEGGVRVFGWGDLRRVGGGEMVGKVQARICGREEGQRAGRRVVAEAHKVEEEVLAARKE